MRGGGRSYFLRPRTQRESSNPTVTGSLAATLGALTASGFATAPGAISTTISLSAERLATGTATTFVSFGVPLQSGQYTPPAGAGNYELAGAVSLWKNGVEQACYIEVLHGRYYDGSAISLLVQAQAGSLAQYAAETGWELRLTQNPGVSRLSKNASAVLDYNLVGCWRPVASHCRALVAAVWGPLVPISDAASTLWAGMDADWAYVSDYRWNTLGWTVAGTESTPINIFEVSQSWYDNSIQHLRYWARGGGTRFLDRGLRMATVHRNYRTAASSVQPERYAFLGIASAYWLTGVTSFRTEVLRSAAQVGMTNGQGSLPNPDYDEGRISGRRQGVLLACWLLGDTAVGYCNGTRTAAAACDEYTALSVSRQVATGRWYIDYSFFVNPTTYQSNFMEPGIRSYYMSLYALYRGPSQTAGVLAAITKQADFLKGSTEGFAQYSATWQTWYYYSNGDESSVDLPGMTSLAPMILVPYARAYRTTGDSAYLTQLDAALTAHIGRAPTWAQADMTVANFAWATRPFTEGYYNYMHSMALREGW